MMRLLAFLAALAGTSSGHRDVRTRVCQPAPQAGVTCTFAPLHCTPAARLDAPQIPACRHGDG